MAPVQVLIIPISDKFNSYANLISNKLEDCGCRFKIDFRNEKMGAKIRKGEIEKIPVMLIVGENEQKNNTVSVRRRFEGNIGEIDFEKYLNTLVDEINSKKRRDLK